MRCRPRVVSPHAIKLANFLDRAVDVCCGPDATFEEREEMAATLIRKARARHARAVKGVPEPDGER